MRTYRISSSFLGVTLTARVAFSARSFPFLQSLVVPWVLCTGQRVMTRLRSLGRHPRSLSAHYRFLSEGKWRMDLLVRCLFKLVLATFPTPSLTLVIDDTLCPKWGRGIYGTARFFDHVHRPRPGYVWGHNWVVLAVVVPLGPRAWVSLPFWIRLYQVKEQCQKGEFRTRFEMAVEALKRVREWYSGPIVLVADGAYFTRPFVLPLKALGIDVISRIRQDADFRAIEPPPRRRGAGRPALHGATLPKLKILLEQTEAFSSLTTHVYGQRVTFRVREVRAYWPALLLPVQIVIARDPRHPRRYAYLVTTDLSLSAKQVVEAFARRWTIEQLFSVAKEQMGLDSAEVRSPRSVVRHAALAMAMITWVEVWFRRSHADAGARSFSYKLAALRAQSVKETIFASVCPSRQTRAIVARVAQLLATATRAA